MERQTLEDGGTALPRWLTGEDIPGRGGTDLATQGLSCPGEADCGREGLSIPRESSHERMGFSFTSLSPQELFSHEESCHCREDLSTSRVSRGRRVLRSFLSLDPCQSGPGEASWGRGTSGSLVPQALWRPAVEERAQAFCGRAGVSFPILVPHIALGSPVIKEDVQLS